jgi:outer membrane lipoprotein carrier protein
MMSERPLTRLVLTAASLACLLSLLATGAWAEATKAEVLSVLKDRYANITGIAADYTRTAMSPSMEKTYKASNRHLAEGRLFFKKPNKLRLNQTSPDPELLITDGTTVWWYIPEENVVQKYSGQELMTQLKPLLDFLNGLGDLEKSFTVTLMHIQVKGESRYELTLAPKAEETDLLELKVWFKSDNYTLTGFRITSTLREVTDFELRAVRFNPDISDSQFQFQAPAEAEVIDME